MAEKFYSEYTAQEIEDLLTKTDKKPFVIYYDKQAQVYRFFSTEERMKAWVKAMEDNGGTDGIPDEIANYEFTGSFTAPAPYTINVNSLKDNQYILYGSKGTTIEYSFQTVDGNGGSIKESVDAYYTFKTPVGTITTSKSYNASPDSDITPVSMIIDDFLALGTNVISILLRGRTTGTTKVVVVTYYVIELSISSSFNISQPIPENTNFSVIYRIKGQSSKKVEFYIDGTFAAGYTVPQLETDATKEQIFDNTDGKWGPGRHTLQIVAKMQAGDQTYSSDILYYEFVITGKPQTVILISEVFPASNGIIAGSQPGLIGEQYVTRILNWAYYSSTNSMATITWRLYVEPSDGGEGYETTLATRTADVVQGENGEMPEPLSFMPTDVGNYRLQAVINNIVIEPDYTISIIPNTNGLYETTEGMSLKLSGLGRSNEEPPETISSWTNKVYSTTFYNQPWNDTSGWKDDALVLNNGATATINIRPFDSSIDAVGRNGCTIEIDFESFNVTNDDCVILNIGGITNGTTQLIIKPSSATLRSNSGVIISTKFKTDERIKLAFVIYKKGYWTTTETVNGEPEIKFHNYVIIFSNGVMSAVADYEEEDQYISNDTISIGNSIVIDDNTGQEVSICGPTPEGTTFTGTCNAGIKIYYLRVYRQSIDMYNELNNYIIDSGVNINSLVNKNDIYTQGTRDISVDKLEGSITTVKITGPLNELINRGKKNIIYGGLEITCPSDPSINMHCSNAQYKNAGQSTLDKPIPSLHVKLDKDNNVCYDRDNKILPKNRWAFREGNVPEKKFRLQANYMDSSCAHNGAFMRLFNQISPRVTINNEYVLRTPAEKYAYEKYPAAMKAAHPGVEDPRGLDWAFPYNLHMVPDSIPCVVVWRETEKDTYKFLGQYVLMEEKKSNFTNCMRSIYDTLDENNYPDPFQFRTNSKTKEGNRLWDNEDCHQMELLTSTDDMTLFLDDKDWNKTEIDDEGNRYLVREKMFELVYPDEDDLREEGGQEAVNQEWQYFYDSFLHPVCETKGSKKFSTGISDITGNWNAFNNLYGTILNRWHFAAYYCLALRNCCSDSMARNMELTTYEKNQNGQSIWLPKWWDVDMQCGLYQTGACNLDPMTTRTTRAPGTPDSFALSGRGFVGNELHSSWLWDGLENCEAFKNDVKAMDKALYAAGWNYININKIMDEEYVNSWSQALYNESGIAKYLDFDELINLQGDRTPHRHWFLRTSYDFFDAVNVCGEYTSKTINVRTEIPYYENIENPSQNVIHYIDLKAGTNTFFGWGTSISDDKTGIQVNKGETKRLDINRSLQLNNPLHVFAASKLEELDFSDIAPFMAADLDLSRTYDSVTGTFLRKVVLGISKEKMNQNIFNRYTTLNKIDGIRNLTKVEYFDIGGLYNIKSLDFSKMSSLKTLHAAGTSLISFTPAGGSNLIDVELPTTIVNISMDGCSLMDSNRHCSIKWYKTVEGENETVTTYYRRVENAIFPWEKLTDEEVNNLDNIDNLPVVNSLDELDKLTNIEIGTIYKVVIIEKTMYVERSSSVPTTVTTLLFTSMGGDRGVQELVTDWITSLKNLNDDSIFENCRLTWTTLQGTLHPDEELNKLNTINIDTLRAIAKIPPSRRNLNGYIVGEGKGPDGSFTSEEMNFLMNAYGDDIFIRGSALCIDCITGDVLVSAVGSDTNVDSNGVINILQGTNATLSASGFPLEEDNPTYVWSIIGNDGQAYTGSPNTPIISYMNVQLNYLTGEINTIEGNYDDVYFNVYVEKSTGGNKQVPVKVLKRSYPDSVSLILANGEGNSGVELLEGVYQIKRFGTYIFDAIFSPSDFNGTLNTVNGGRWALIGSDSNYVRREDSNYGEGKNRDIEYRLVVSNLPDFELPMNLYYTANWKNTLSLQAPIVSINLAKIIGVLSSSITFGNPALYSIIELYFTQQEIDLDEDDDLVNCFSSVELKRATGIINFADLANSIPNFNLNSFTSLYSRGSATGSEYNVASYLTNITGLNLSGCYGLTRDVDISDENTKYQILNLEGTNVNAILGTETKLTSLLLGRPTSISIINPVNLKSTDISVEHSENLESITLINLKDKKAFSEISEIIDAGADESLTHLYIEQGTSNQDEEEINAKVIDNLAYIVSLGNLDNTSDVIGRIYSPYIYEESKNILIGTNGNNGYFDNLIIRWIGFYIPFIDHAFREVVAVNWGEGPGTGLKPTDINNITSLYKDGVSVVQNNEDIVNLSDLDKLTKLNFNTTQTLSTATFLGCTNLTSIKFPRSTTKINEYTFANNNNLVNIDFSLCTSLSKIEDNAFYNCTGIADINLSTCNSLEYANLEGLVNLDEIIVDGNNTINTLKI